MENNPTIIEVTFNIRPGDRLAEIVRKGMLESIAKQYPDQCIVYKDYRAPCNTYCISFPNAEDAVAFQLKHGSDLEQLRKGPNNIRTTF